MQDKSIDQSEPDGLSALMVFTLVIPTPLDMVEVGVLDEIGTGDSDGIGLHFTTGSVLSSSDKVMLVFN